MTRAARQHLVPPALELVEEGVELLRRAGAVAWAAYLAGAAPFLLGLLHFWTDMSRGAGADARCLPGAALLAALFLGLKLGQGFFAARLTARVTGEEPEPPGRTARRVAEDLPLHALQLFLLAAAWLLVAPLPWVLAFGLTLGVRPAVREETLGRRWAAVVRLAAAWPAQTLGLAGLLLALGFFVLLNVAVALLQLPWLLKTFLGVDTPFTLAGEAALNSTFLAVAVGLAWLLLDPLARAAFVLRTFHAEARTTGADLLVRLRRATAPAAAVAAVLLLCVVTPPNAHAAEGEVPAASPLPAGQEALDRAADAVLAGPAYAWRLPRERLRTDAESSWLARWLRDRLRGLLDWLEELFGGRRDRGGGGSAWPDASGWLLALLAAGLVAAVAVALLRQRRPAPALAAQALPAAPDLRDDDVTADQQPEDGWLALARGHAARGDFRLALRALHLAVLAHLAARDCLRIARHRTNRQYAAELARRARARPALLAAFAEITADFERAWYGAHPATAETLARAEARYADLRAC